VTDPSPGVFVTVFADGSRAALADRDLARLEEEGMIALLAAAVISRDIAGEIHWMVRGRAGRHLCARADVIATMLGVVLPPRVIASGLTAAALDGAGGEAAEREFTEGFMPELGAAAEPGGSILIAVIDDRWAAEMERGLRGYHHLTRAHR
jgi:uncharacterized membrane protein